VNAHFAGDSRYLAADATSTLVINQATLTVQAQNASRVYGAANPLFTAAYSGFVPGDSFANSVTGSPLLSSAATSTSPVGSYGIVASLGTLTASNYTFVFVSGTLNVTTAATTISLTSSSNISVPGQYIVLNANVSAATGDIPGGSVTFRDGSVVLATIPLVNGFAGTTVSFVSLGVHNIVAVYNPDTNHSGSISNNLMQTVSPQALVPDQNGKYQLYVGGTSADDQIQVQVASNGRGYQIQIESSRNGTTISTYALTATAPAPISRVITFGLDGNDQIQLNTGSTVINEIFGGAGNDVLQSGPGSNILIGGDGNDTVTSGGGAGVLVGGRGADNVKAGSGNTALIGGYTIYDEPTPANLAVLDNILASVVSGGASLASLLTSSSVHDDTSIDTLTGGTTGIDWFYANVTIDVINKKKSNDKVISILGW
jgi:Ca2+-binding RTX toxin-like protein